VLGYGLLGVGWIIMKTEGDLQERAFRLMKPLGAAVLFAIVAVSLWTPLLHEGIAARWFSWPNIAYLSPVPLLVAVTAAALYRAIEQRRNALPFILGLVLFLLSYIGLGISLFPHVIPPNVTIWQAAAPTTSLLFLLVGAAVLLPIILGYTAYAYWVFRGKVRPGEGYH
jgi:cytochrome d ubiquinol oxidase subunit II